MKTVLRLSCSFCDWVGQVGFYDIVSILVFVSCFCGSAVVSAFPQCGINKVYRTKPKGAEFGTLCILMHHALMSGRVIMLIAADSQSALVFPDLLFCHVGNDEL